MMVFFVSVGLLLDLRFIWANIGTVVLLLLMVTVFKTLLNVGALKLLGQGWPRAFMIGVTLAQVGEFSFLLAEIGQTNHLIGKRNPSQLVAVTVLSLMLSPVWLMTARRLHALAVAGVTSPRELVWAFSVRSAWKQRRKRLHLPGRVPDAASASTAALSPAAGKRLMPDFPMNRPCRASSAASMKPGRGPLAGPVVAAAVIHPPTICIRSCASS